MLFNSFAFFVFLCVTATVFFVLPQRWRPLWLALTSFYFYMYGRPESGWLLFTSIIVSYLAGLAMARWSSDVSRRGVLIFSVGCNLALLFLFKYSDFLIGTANWVLKTNFPPLGLSLPVGISFFTFQAIAYCVDVYHRRFPTESRLDVFAAYKAFFPQLVAGPIERPANVIPQLTAKHSFDFDRMTSGLRLIIWGLFKKLVIADRLAILVTDAYSHPSSQTGLQLVAATYAFSIQIFCDFSAYTDIARGCARILGIQLMENFRQPYFSRSIPEFWSRWHISLSTWFRDYLYIPLGGNRSTVGRWTFNILIVFLVSGLWHGANWKFVVWGLLHGVFFLGFNWAGRSVLKFTRIPVSVPMRNILQCLLTFHLVTFAWIFFRAGSMSDAWTIIQTIFEAPPELPILTQNFGTTHLIIVSVAIGILFIVEILQATVGAAGFLERQPLLLRWAAYYLLIFGIVLFAQSGQKDFIYFQF